MTLYKASPDEQLETKSLSTVENVARLWHTIYLYLCFKWIGILKDSSIFDARIFISNNI